MLEKADRHPATRLEAANVLKHLAPLNQRRLDQINVTVIEKLRDDLLAKSASTLRPLAPRSISRIMSSLAAIFKVAMRKGYVTTNPAAVAQRPRNPVREVKDDAKEETGALRPDEVLSSDEIARLVEHAEPGLWKTYIATAAACGLRSEEINALTWGDVELATGKLFVRRSLAWTREAGETGAVCGHGSSEPRREAERARYHWRPSWSRCSRSGSSRVRRRRMISCSTRPDYRYDDRACRLAASTPRVVAPD